MTKMVLQISEISHADFEQKFKELKSLLKKQDESSKKIINDEIYFTRKQLAAKFDVELSTIHNWCKKGYLKPLGIGNRVYFKKSDVDQALMPLNR